MKDLPTRDEIRSALEEAKLQDDVDEVGAPTTPAWPPFMLTAFEIARAYAEGRLVEPRTARPADDRQIGWFDPATRRFCYRDKREAWPGDRATYTVPVFAGNLQRVDVVFSGEQPDLTFIEVEDEDLASISIGTWYVDDDGLHRLTIDVLV